MRRTSVVAILLVLALLLAFHGKHAGAAPGLRPLETVTVAEISWLLIEASLSRGRTALP